MTKADLLEWQSEMWNKTNPSTGKLYAQKTCVQARSILSTFIQWASEMYNFENPFPSMNRPKRKETKPEMQVWTIDQFKKFCDNCPKDMVLFYKFLFYSGCRVGEVNALRIEDVRLKGNTYILHISKTETKNSGLGGGFSINPPKTATSNRDVTLPTGLTKETTEFLKGRTGFVFGGESPLNEHRYQRCFNDTIEKAGLPHIRIHDLRHSHAGDAEKPGVPITTISKRLGHSTVKMTLDVYSHCYKEKEDETVQLPDEMMKQKQEPYKKPSKKNTKAS